ncbi:uncharacterized protein LOC129723654 [Wyeomyia smithii]|uniref:uncharacterized protein LOC129723654 n=1 Tax=Wyeomyia smithii TaxID=174621 RepID=UPI0024680D36|nr:uncharacterized protein LOC129723654 [Wyeomyia smithii]
MNESKHAVFCRLCLVETRNRVVIFPGKNPKETKVRKLLELVQIEVCQETEPGAVLCFECLATLEEFNKFKTHCHENDKHLKNLHRKSDKVHNKQHHSKTHSSNLKPIGTTKKEEKESNKTPRNFDMQYQKFLGTQKDVSDKTCKKPRTDLSPKDKAFSKIPSTVSGISALNKMLVLSESYEHSFHFEKRPRSVHFNLVYNGERFNSAIFTARLTYWQCVHRMKHNCKAQVCCTNDYKHFERRHLHSHGKLPEKSGTIYQPAQALPMIFHVCRTFVEKRLGERSKTVEDEKTENPEPVVPAGNCDDTRLEQSNIELEVDDICLESTEFVNLNDVDSSYEIETLDESNQDLLLDVDHDYYDTGKKTDGTDDEMNTDSIPQAKKRTKKYSVDVIPTKVTRFSATTHVDNMDVENKANDSTQSTKFHFTVDPNVVGKSDFSDPVLAESYPEYFYFEKGSRSVYYTLVFFGERFNSARYGVNYTYWQCSNRKKYRCEAMLVTSNDYTAFERRYYHTHDQISLKYGRTIFQPREVLPQLFKITRSKSAWKQRCGIMNTECSDNERIEDSSLEKDDKTTTGKNTKKKAKVKHQNTVNIPKECEVHSMPTLDKMLVLADSYPDFFYFERGPRSTYFTLIYKGERYNTPLFTTRRTYWQCAHRTKFRCPARISVSNDYRTFKPKNDHCHDKLEAKEETAYSPEEALPLIFEACRKIAYKKRSHDLLKRLCAKEAIELQESKDQENPDSSHEEDDFLGFCNETE